MNSQQKRKQYITLVIVALMSAGAMIAAGHLSTTQQSFLTAPCPERSGYIACTTDGYSMCAENTPRYVCRNGHWLEQR